MSAGSSVKTTQARFDRISQLLQESSYLYRRKYDFLAQRQGALPNKADGILLRPFVPHCMLKQNAYDSFGLITRLRSDGQAVQPLFDPDRLLCLSAGSFPSEER